VRALNLACSNENGFASMTIPDDPLTGENLYRAAISERGSNMTSISRIRIDDFPLPFDGLRLVKVDAEGHDSQVIDGMWKTISKHLPVLITEHPTEELIARLAGLGYQFTHQSGSPNGVFIPTRLAGEPTHP
jgi:FkbM family methyltransferase